MRPPAKLLRPWLPIVRAGLIMSLVTSVPRCTNAENHRHSELRSKHGLRADERQIMQDRLLELKLRTTREGRDGSKRSWNQAARVSFDSPGGRLSNAVSESVSLPTRVSKNLSTRADPHLGSCML